MTGWYLNRLKTLSAAEFPYRVRQLCQKKYEQYFCAGKVLRVETLKTNPLKPFYTSFDYTFPDSINIFGKPFSYFREGIEWHKDIFSGECFPRSFSKNINIRSNQSLSAKNVWEINRLQFLPHIAFNYKKTGDEVYLQKFMSLMDSWIENNPYLIGVNWYSNIEINIRLINWFICWQVLDADQLCKKNPEFKLFVEEKWLPVIHLHCIYSYKNPSKFSSSNNHLIAEYSGLFVASSLWVFNESHKWLAYSRKGLEKEIRRQHSEGINREEAAEYIQFITDFFLFPYLIALRTGNHFSKGYQDTLNEILLYIRNFIDCKGNFPKYGDEDDGRCFILDVDERFNNFESLLVSAAIIFNDMQFKRKTGIFDLKNLFLFGNEGKKLFDNLPTYSSTTKSVFYKEQGHFIFKKSEGEKEIYLHFDAAPLGFLSIAAHGHADALSFILHIEGHPFFIDSGTYTYHTEPEWRDYFIGTLAHNTVRINRKNQALNGGSTLWLNHYKPSVLSVKRNAQTESVRASHDGFEKEGVSHIREIIFDRDKSEFTILDTLHLKKEASVEVEIPFHLHPGVSIETIYPNIFSISSNTGERLEFAVDKKLFPVVETGKVSPEILGWYSDSFCKKTPANVIYCSTTIKETTTFKFAIKIC